MSELATFSVFAYMYSICLHVRYYFAYMLSYGWYAQGQIM